MIDLHDDDRVTVSMLSHDYSDTRCARHTFNTSADFIGAILRTPKPLSALTPRISSGVYEGDTRSQATFLESRLVPIEYDGKEHLVSRERLQAIPFRSVWHTTKSDSAECLRARGFIILPHTLTLQEHFALFAELRQELPPGLDPLCANPAQPWLAPCMPPSGRFDAWLNDKPELEPGPYLLRYAARKAREAEERAKDRPSDPTLNYQRAEAYVSKMDAAISGAGGHTATFRAAAKLVCGFGLGEEDAMRILEQHYNPRCSPPWRRADLRHKVRSAMRTTREIGRVEDRQVA